MLMTVTSIIKVMSIIRSGEHQTLDSGETLVITENGTAPFSWMKYIVEMSHPGFFKYLREKELTDWEINYCCLYLIGLKGKDIGDYINLKRHYVYGSAIRQKLGLTENDTNLNLHLQKMLKNM